MITDEIRAAIEERKKTDDEWEYAVEQCWKKEAAILSKDMQQTIAFLDNECTADEFSWLSEIFYEVAEQTQSGEFIACLRRVAEKFPEECKIYNVWSFIQEAASCIDADTNDAVNAAERSVWKRRKNP